jgi:tripartite-type tricarboxylate transporter receptor subunit TctC
MRRWIPFACAALVGFAGGARAEVYPSRPITVIVPLAAGAPTDSLMRCGRRALTQALPVP